MSSQDEQIAQRRDLTLSVEGRFDPVADTEALKRAKLERLIESRRDTAAAAAAAAGGSTLETILEALFVEQFSADALAAERQRRLPVDDGRCPGDVLAPRVGDHVRGGERHPRRERLRVVLPPPRLAQVDPFPPAVGERDLDGSGRQGHRSATRRPSVEDCRPASTSCSPRTPAAKS